MKIDYNAPVILTFTIAAVMIFLLSVFVFPDLARNFFVVRPPFNASNPWDWFRLVSHVLGHGNFDHLFNNVLVILLIGPILEERYGSFNVLWMMLLTALVTGIINVTISSRGLWGASGIAFLLIILVSIVNVKRNSIPLSFVLIFCIFIGGEMLAIFEDDNISQMAHIVGGTIGAILGFFFARPLN